ncbi:hypothetical protein ACFVWY_00345 [Streptomyces sp. NPDC058195]|uniref:hypothetical protein n=1 Tax=Streptomyces sp. NPDC058195 TaxID=3346375 RepID=UPI0036EC1396
MSILLERLEERAGEASDRDVKELGETLLKLSERLAERRYRVLLDVDQLEGVSLPEREPLRLALGAVLALLMSGASIAFLQLLGLSDGLEPVAIATSVVVSAVIVFRGKAMNKLESLGILGGSSERSR